MHNIVEKIDMASQDYAENIELATDTASAVALGGGFLTGFLANALSKLLKIKNPIIQKGIGPFAGLITTLAIAIGATRLQKEGARVGGTGSESREVMHAISSIGEANRRH